MCSVLDMIYSTTPVTPKDNKKKFYAADFTKQSTLVAFSLFFFVLVSYFFNINVRGFIQISKPEVKHSYTMAKGIPATFVVI